MLNQKLIVECRLTLFKYTEIPLYIFFYFFIPQPWVQPIFDFLNIWEHALYNNRMSESTKSKC